MNTRAVAPPFPIVAWLQRRPRWQKRISLAAALVAFAWFAFRTLCTALLDRWWFSTVTRAPMWRTQMTAKVTLGLVSGLLVLVVLGGSVLLVFRTGRRIFGPVNRALRWYHDRMGPAHRWVVVGLALYLGAGMIATMVGSWQQLLLYRHGHSLGQSVPAVGGDLGDFLFSLPFRRTVSSFLRQLLIASFVLALLGHAVSGSLRWPRGIPSRRTAVAHLALLGGVFSVVQILHYLLVAKPQLALNRSGGFVGAGWTERFITSPALIVTALAAVPTVAALGWFVAKGAWRPAAKSAAVWAGVHVVALVAVPMAAERFVVQPSAGARQLAAYAANLDFTRQAYGLADIAQPTPLGAADTTVDGTASPTGVPIFDPAQLSGALQTLRGRTGTRVFDTDLDRYTVDGVRRPVLIGARQPDLGGLPASGWVQQNLVYTHGAGVVVLPADVAAADGRPDVAALDAELPHDPNTYFGEGLDGWYAIVATKRTQQDGAVYRGDAGIGVHSLVHRVIAATALGDAQIVLSGEFTDASKLLLRRGLNDRLRTLAPFLAWDSDPYPAVIDRQVVWFVDGYTTADTFPYAEYYGSAGLPATSDLARRTLNYARLAVRAVVNANTGSVQLYRAAEPGRDPILDVWDSVYPGLMKPVESIPSGIAAHLRYPADLFTVQTELLGRYHVENPEDLFSGQSRWNITGAASVVPGKPADYRSPAVTSFGMLDAPDAWASVRTYSQGSTGNPLSGRDPLVAAALVDNDTRGSLRLVAMAPAVGEQVASPRIAQSAIDADPQLSETITLRNSNGSTLRFSPPTPIVHDGTLVWVRSYSVSSTMAGATPTVQQVIVVSNGRVATGATVAQALAALGDR